MKLMVCSNLVQNSFALNWANKASDSGRLKLWEINNTACGRTSGVCRRLFSQHLHHYFDAEVGHLRPYEADAATRTLFRPWPETCLGQLLRPRSMPVPF